MSHTSAIIIDSNLLKLIILINIQTLVTLLNPLSVEFNTVLMSIAYYGEEVTFQSRDSRRYFAKLFVLNAQLHWQKQESSLGVVELDSFFTKLP